jgi:predicted ATP-dependent serine protease
MNNFTSSKSLPLNGYEMNKDKVEYIGGMFPRGRLSSLVGAGEAGKSFTLIAAAMSISNSKIFLPTNNYIPTNNEGILLIETEGRMSLYAERLKDLGANLNNFTVPVSYDHVCRYSNQIDRKNIEEALEVDKHKLVILDSFSFFSNVDENTYQVMDCLNWLVDLAVKYNTAVVFTQLVNKSTTNSGKITANSMRGFSGLNQLPQVIWALESIDKQHKRLYQVKNNSKGKDDEYIIEISDNDVQVVETRKRTTRWDVYQENKTLPAKKLLELLQENEPDTDKQALNMWIRRQKQAA